MKIGIIGKGYFGKKIKEKLEKFCEITFFTGKDFSVSNNIDWAIVASSNDSHYDVVKYFLNKKINVFCEKPPTKSFNETLELINLSKNNNVKLYFDDVYLYNYEFIKRFKTISSKNNIEFIWKKYGSFKDTIFNNLTYHDLYILIFSFGVRNISNLKFIINRINKKDFRFNYDNISCKFIYDRTSDINERLIKTNDCIIDFSKGLNDSLYDMLYSVLNNHTEFEYNNWLALESQKLLDELNNYKPKVAVVGAGIFGLNCAFELKKNNLNVDIYESNSDILQNASSINQYRLHRGYHYPRSLDTAISSKEGTKTFLEKFDCLPSKKSEHYYCISKNNSFVTGTQFINFLNLAKLEYEHSFPNDILYEDKIDVSVKVNEHSFDPEKLKEIIKKEITNYHLDIKFDTLFRKSDINFYDYIINCTYSNLNCLLDNDEQIDYQYEICEKPVILLPDIYKNKSIVIMDGPFMCIDPLGDTNYHVIGHVVHAIHSSNIGKFPIIPEQFKNLLNKGIVNNPNPTKIHDFIKSSSLYFKYVNQHKHIGSMYTIRTVLPNREYDDARPSVITKHKSNLYSIFSGKISTCVDVANEFVNKINITD